MRFTGAAIVALAVSISAHAAPPPAPPAELFDRSHDRILQRAAITSRGRTHGEVRLVERGPVRVVQTLLYSRLLRRVVSEIGMREHANWPADRAGHEASERYLAALDRAEQAIPPASERGTDAQRRRSLLIEFAVSKSAQAVGLLAPEIEKREGELVIEAARLIEAIELPREFVQRDMRLIAEEHFAIEPAELARLLAPPGAADDARANAEDGIGVGP